MLTAWKPSLTGLTLSLARGKSGTLHDPEQQDLRTLALPVVPAVGPICTLAEDGKRLHKMIVALLNEGYSVTLDFTGVRLVTQTFYNAVVGDLNVRFPVVRITTINLPVEPTFR